ncbi:MAG: O-antigen ligase family protein [Elusimicrobia bacterium]|nr:O-antigen ligase family protein [Elusimicrobiota bacterium]
MTPFVLFAGLGVGGLRSQWPWTAFAVVSWAVVLAAPPRRRLPGAWLWGAALGWTFLSAALSPEPLVSLPAAAYAATAFAWLQLGATRSGDDERRWAARLLWLSASVFAACAAGVTVPGYSAVGLLYPYYNYTAALVAAAGAAAAAAWAVSRAPLGLAGCAASAAYLAWCGSRGGMAALAAAAAFALWRNGRRGLVLAGALAASAALLAPSAARDSFLKRGSPGSHGRPQIWRAAAAVAADSPFLGEGPGRFERGFLRHQVPAPEALGIGRYALVAGRAHSEPLGAAAETGFVGAALLFAALWALWRRLPAPVGDASRECLLAAAAALGVQALGDSIFALPALGWLFAWTLGAGCVPDAQERPLLAEPVRRALVMVGLAFSALAWLPGWYVGYSLGRDPRAAIAVAPYDSAVWDAVTRQDYKKQDLRRAYKALTVVSALRPFDARPKVMAAELLLGWGARDAARGLAGAAAALEPDCGQARLVLAQAALADGDKDEARRQLAALKASRSQPLKGEYWKLLVGHDAALLSRLESLLAPDY